MNQQTSIFLAELQERPEVLGIILFGSRARGNNRPDSDVDLVVIVKDGHRRAVEVRDNQIFEIIYTTAESALEYWSGNRDDAAGLWAVARVLYDADGTTERLQEATEKILQAGKTPIDEFERGQMLFDSGDVLKYVGLISASDPVTANLMLAQKVFNLTERFFDLRGLWTPAPKQRLAEIEKISPEFYELLKRFSDEGSRFEERLQIAGAMIGIVFQEKEKPDALSP